MPSQPRPNLSDPSLSCEWPCHPLMLVPSGCTLASPPSLVLARCPSIATQPSTQGSLGIGGFEPQGAGDSDEEELGTARANDARFSATQRDSASRDASRRMNLLASAEYTRNSGAASMGERARTAGSPVTPLARPVAHACTVRPGWVRPAQGHQTPCCVRMRRSAASSEAEAAGEKARLANAGRRLRRGMWKRATCRGGGRRRGTGLEVVCAAATDGALQPNFSRKC